MKIFSILANILLSLILICIVLLLIPLVPGLNRWYQVVVIQSGSMEPTLPVGSIVLYKPISNYLPEDVVVFAHGDGADIKTVVHRITQKRTSSDGSVAYITKGDANTQADGLVVYASAIKGEVFAQIPHVGYVIQFLKSPMGIIGSLSLLISLLIISELVRKE